MIRFASISSAILLLAFLATAFLVTKALYDQSALLESKVKELGQKAAATEGKLDKAADEIHDLYDRPVALCRTELDKAQVLKNGILNVINYSEVLYDTHKSVVTGPNWFYKARKDGIYSVTAYVAFGQKIPMLQMALMKGEKVERYLAVVYEYPGGAMMLGGTAPVALKQGESFSIRVKPDGAGEVKTGTAGTEWIWIRYERPIPPGWLDQ